VEKRTDEAVLEVESEGGIYVYANCKKEAGTELFLCAGGSECSRKQNFKGGAFVHAWFIDEGWSVLEVLARGRRRQRRRQRRRRHIPLFEEVFQLV
jgi:hypothetical protein